MFNIINTLSAVSVAYVRGYFCSVVGQFVMF